MVPLFPGVPGGPELLVILLLMIALFGLPVVIVAVFGWRYLDRNDQVEELEARVRELESELDADAQESEPDTDDRREE
ncbi:Sec-independent protein translocase subunit TatA/TatB [Salinigranum sp. GCM10025319]|uniref:Sec-independent protein translocase subunit TatA/TatB n=1 Tax=Salinigranum sp. GCM10025319 TaxID=3252687 RepID=UPI003621A8F4